LVRKYINNRWLLSLALAFPVRRSLALPTVALRRLGGGSSEGGSLSLFYLFIFILINISLLLPVFAARELWSGSKSRVARSFFPRNESSFAVLQQSLSD